MMREDWCEWKSSGTIDMKSSSCYSGGGCGSVSIGTGARFMTFSGSSNIHAASENNPLDAVLFNELDAGTIRKIGWWNLKMNDQKLPFLWL